MTSTRFVDAEWLAAHIAEPATVVIEVTNNPADDNIVGTIPGARAVYWKSLLWHPDRREFASVTALTERLRRLGAGESSTVVFAGEPTQFAAYTLWVAAARGIGGTLKYLDGGIEAWLLSDQPATPVPQRAVPDVPLPLRTPRFDDIVVGRDGVLDAIAAGTPLVDLRTPDEFSGRRVSPATESTDHGAERYGHIPGARNLNVRELLDEHGRVLTISDLRTRIDELDIADTDALILYCRLSHRAALGWLVFEDLLGERGVRVYDGSWTEWGSIVGVPVER